VIFDAQAMTSLLTMLGISVGAVLILGVALVAGTAVWSRHGRRARIQGVERYLAAVAGRRDRAQTPRS
jgi:uncharacterized protein YcfJ